MTDSFETTTGKQSQCTEEHEETHLHPPLLRTAFSSEFTSNRQH